MGEIVAIHVGQCGVNIGSQFWSQLICEHSITAATCGSALSPATFFHETAGGYEPRGLFFDTDSTSLDAVCGSPLGRYFPLDHFIGSSGGTSNNFSSGCYFHGGDMNLLIEESICKEAEKCDYLSGFLLSSSICGGTGSGLLTCILQVPRFYYCTSLVDCYSVFPSPGGSEGILEGYNSLLAMTVLCENADRVMVLDNQALNKAYERLASRPPTVTNVNGLVANAMCGVTACCRFPGPIRCGLRKMAVWLVPFPRLHFLSLATLPPVPAYPPLTAESLASQVFDPRSVMSSADPRSGVFLSAVACSRGKVSASELEELSAKGESRWSASFVPYLPKSAKGLMCDQQSPGKELDCTVVSNNSAVASVFRTVHRKFQKLYKRRAFTHIFTRNGVDNIDFDEPQDYLLDVISKYQQTEIEVEADEDEE